MFLRKKGRTIKAHYRQTMARTKSFVRLHLRTSRTVGTLGLRRRCARHRNKGARSTLIGINALASVDREGALACRGESVASEDKVSQTLRHLSAVMLGAETHLRGTLRSSCRLCGWAPPPPQFQARSPAQDCSCLAQRWAEIFLCLGG